MRWASRSPRACCSTAPLAQVPPPARPACPHPGPLASHCSAACSLAPTAPPPTLQDPESILPPLSAASSRPPAPPPAGKTLLARAVAHHTDCTFIRVSGGELVQKYIGEGSRMVRELFVMARCVRSAVCGGAWWWWEDGGGSMRFGSMRRGALAAACSPRSTPHYSPPFAPPHPPSTHAPPAPGPHPLHPRTRPLLSSLTAQGARALDHLHGRGRLHWLSPHRQLGGRWWR